MSEFKIKSYHISIDGIKGLQVIALNDKNDLIGSCLMHFDTIVAMIQDLFVVSEYRGEGVSTGMLQECKNAACEALLTSIYVYVHKNNKYALDFWKSSSFFVCGQDANYLTMTKALSYKMTRSLLYKEEIE